MASASVEGGGTSPLAVLLIAAIIGGGVMFAANSCDGSGESGGASSVVNTGDGSAEVADDTVRPEQVERLTELMWNKQTSEWLDDSATNAGVPGTRFEPQADALLDAAVRNSSPAEVRAAEDVFLRRSPR